MLQPKILILLICLWPGFLPLAAQDLHFRAAEILTEAGNGGDDWDPEGFEVRREHGLIILEHQHPPGFVIFKQQGNETLLIAYSTRNLFFDPLTSLPLNSDWLAAMELCARSLKTGFDGYQTHFSKVTPMISTRWSQDQRFSRACPPDPRSPSGHTYPGCVAVAMGQILHFFNHYNHFNLSHSYQHPEYGLLMTSLGNHAWNRLEEDPICVDPDVSELLFGLGVLCHMDFGHQGSSTSAYMALQSFHQLGYDNAVIYRRSDMNADSWIGVMTENLRINRPLLVMGGGHAFVCDGMDAKGFMHFNLGGGGYGDGYYLPAMAFGYPVNEMIADLAPAGYPAVQLELRLLKTLQEGASFVINSPEDAGQEQRYRIYLDGMLIGETQDTVVVLDTLTPGQHRLQVSTFVKGQETTWTTPLTFFIRGPLVRFADPNLDGAVRLALGYGFSDVEQAEYYAGALAGIRQLVVDQPVADLSGLEYLSGLRSLVYRHTAGIPADLSRLTGLSKLRMLTLEGTGTADIPADNQLTELVVLNLSGIDDPDPGWIKDPSGILELRLNHITSFDPGFLKDFTRIENLVISATPLEDLGFLGFLPDLKDLELSAVGLSELNSTNWPARLESLVLSDNLLKDMAGIQHLRCLRHLDLSGNRLTELRLFDPYTTLEYLDASDNQIENILISADLPRLTALDLSGNRLRTPGRLFLYTPAMHKLNLSGNGLETLSPYRAPVLEEWDLSDNRLTVLNGIQTHPGIRRLDLSGNQISDFSPLLSKLQTSKMDELNLNRNPVSEQSFKEVLPELRKRVIHLLAPVDFEPLSPCYISPAAGNIRANERVTFDWYCRSDNADIRYEWRMYRGDTISQLVSHLNQSWLTWDIQEGDQFEWQVGSRLGDTVIWSGRYPVKAFNAFSLPFFENFESYQSEKSWPGQSPYWGVAGQPSQQGSVIPVIDTLVSRDGKQSLKLDQMAGTVLDLSHLEEEAMQLRFSTWIPWRRAGSWTFSLEDGWSIQVVVTSSSVGKLYVNDRLHATFQADQHEWTSWRISLSARNRRIFVIMNQQTILNEPWIFSEGKVQPSFLKFTAAISGEGDAFHPCLLYLDEVSVTVSGATIAVDEGISPEGFSVWPNPFTDHLTIDPGELHGKGMIRIYSLTGSLVSETTIDLSPHQPLNLNTTALRPGFYMLELITVESKLLTRLVKWILN